MEIEKTVLTQKVTLPDIDGGGVEMHSLTQPVEQTDMGAAAVFSDLVPQALRQSISVIAAEHVALHALDLPVRSARQRFQALPFALEDAVGCGLEQVHFALLGTGAGGKSLAAVIDAETVERFLDEDPHKTLVPEQCLLLPPEAREDGSPVWIAYRRADRVLVRASDGTGFAAQVVMFPGLWHAAGKPRLESYGAPLPDALVWTDCSDQPVPHAVTFVDIRQGRHQPPRGYARPLKTLVACLALAAVAHLGIAVFDTDAQRAIATGLRAQAASVLAEHLPGASPDDPPGLILRQLADLNQPQRGSGFLPLMQRTSGALSLQPAAIQFRQLNWTADILRLSVEAPDLAALQRAEADLNADGLQVSVGSASADAGAARAELTVRP